VTSPQDVFEVVPANLEGDQQGAGTPTVTTSEPLSRGKLIRRRFLRSRSGLLGVAMLVTLILMAVLGPMISKWDFSEPDFTAILQGPSGNHWFGGDSLGRDIFVRTMDGLRKSLIIGFFAAVLTTGIAAIAGSLAGYFGRFVDVGIVWIIDLLLVIPSFLILAILSPILSGKTWLWMIPLLSVFSWMITGRVIRGMTLSLKEREYVAAARFMGVPAATIIRRHLIPNMASLLIVDVTINVGATILAETALSFFGFGVQAPDVSLGSLIGQYQTYATTFPFTVLFSSLALILTVLSVSLIGDALRDAIDPTSGSSRL
jgi:glutathione transport system permease protein